MQPVVPPILLSNSLITRGFQAKPYRLTHGITAHLLGKPFRLQLRSVIRTASVTRLTPPRARLKRTSVLLLSIVAFNIKTKISISYAKPLVNNFFYSFRPLFLKLQKQLLRLQALRRLYLS